jgi:hypothetical protein
MRYRTILGKGGSQIQLIPSPALWIGRSSQDLIERVSGAVVLQSVISVNPQSRTVPDDNANATTIVLVSVLVNGPQPRTVPNENASGNIVLASLINVAAIIETDTDTGTGNINLASVINVLPVSRTVTDENANGNVVLQSLIV